jgi:outer membrane scaffolding protein for murein synthesis (MipA/OmpV family)
MRPLLLALLFLIPATAFAADPLPGNPLGTLLGAGVRSRPEYDGSSKQELQPIPIVRYYGEYFFARTTQGILEGGARGRVAPGLYLGAQIAYEEGNDRTDLDPGGSFGVHLEWDTMVGPAPLTLLARGRNHFDTDQGAQIDLRATVGVYAGHGALVALFGQYTHATGEWVRSYYGAGDSGPLFSAFGVESAYDLSARWVLLASLQLRRLHGDAATSPITEEKTNYFASAGVAYRF